MGKRAALFPGQGSQYVGMAKDLFEQSVEAKEMIQTADDAAETNLSHVMFHGPEESLKRTEYTQPAIYAHSVVVASLVRRLEFDGAAGHSLGEYSALTFAGAVQFRDAVKLVRLRGLAMQDAGEKNNGTMAAIIGMEREPLEAVCEKASEAGVVQCANFNSPGQIVISGSVEGVRRAMELAKEAGARMAKELVVSGAFHSPLMEPARETLEKALAEANLYEARIPVYANVTAKPNADKETTRELLAKQLTAPVRWEETIRNMLDDGFDEFVEIGPGKVLQGLVKRIDRSAKTFGIETFEQLGDYR
jgi:[acyl-carrier-protein] S-malonyltransferase